MTPQRYTIRNRTTGHTCLTGSGWFFGKGVRVWARLSDIVNKVWDGRRQINQTAYYDRPCIVTAAEAAALEPFEVVVYELVEVATIPMATFLQRDMHLTVTEETP